jgi:hypothetical protein
MTQPWREPDIWSRHLKADEPRTCIKCGCTDDDCTGCVERTGKQCWWVKDNLCSACVDPADEVVAL